MSKKITEEKSSYLGIDPIPRLLLKQALPAAIGFMVMSVNMVVDTFFVGQYIGELAIGAISVIFPISFLLKSSIRMILKLSLIKLNSFFMISLILFSREIFFVFM